MAYHKVVALKTEPSDNQHNVLRIESAILSHLQGLPYFPCHIDYGHEQTVFYLAMGELGENLQQVRHRNGGRFSLYTSLMLGGTMLRAISTLHRRGYLHRDIKPANFCLRVPLEVLTAVGDATIIPVITDPNRLGGRAFDEAAAEMMTNIPQLVRRISRHKPKEDKDPQPNVEEFLTWQIQAGTETLVRMGLRATDRSHEQRESQLVAQTSRGTEIVQGAVSGAPPVYKGLISLQTSPDYAYAALAGESFSPVMIDFGLARRYLEDNGVIRPARNSPGFRGTARYASVTAHDGKELGPVDDLWSWFYILIENITGVLPWKRLRNHNAITRMKHIYSTPERLCDGLPSICYAICDYIYRLSYQDVPDYDRLATSLLKKAHDLLPKGDPGLPDWAVGQPARPFYEPTTPFYKNLMEDPRPPVLSDRDTDIEGSEYELKITAAKAAQRTQGPHTDAGAGYGDYNGDNSFQNNDCGAHNSCPLGTDQAGHGGADTFTAYSAFAGLTSSLPPASADPAGLLGPNFQSAGVPENVPVLGLSTGPHFVFAGGSVQPPPKEEPSPSFMPGFAPILD